MLTIMTANRLGDGRVVYLARTGHWSTNINLAVAVSDPENVQIILARGAKDAAARLILAPYLIDVDRDIDGLRPRTLKEKIRAQHGRRPISKSTSQELADVRL